MSLDKVNLIIVRDPFTPNLWAVKDVDTGGYIYGNIYKSACKEYIKEANMETIYIHIYNGRQFMDEDVFVMSKYPIVPRKGDYLYLPIKDIRSLVECVLDNNKFNLYEDKYFDGEIDEEKLNTLSIEEVTTHFSFRDCVLVREVAFTRNKQIHVELFKGWID